MYYIVLFIVLSGCDVAHQNELAPEPIVSLNVWMDLPKDNGEYVFYYPTEKQSSYAHIKYQTNPMERVFWTSPDFFTIIHWGVESSYPVVNYSTYSDGETGLGTQLCYIYQDHIGDTLDIIGCGTDMCDTTRFIVK